MANHLTPNFHLIPAQGQWQNDPCGPYFDGEMYHLFYQNNPFETFWANMHWGEYISEDFIHWEYADDFGVEPEYLRNPGGPVTFDQYHAFSGSSLADGVDGKPTLFYTGITRDDLGSRGLFWRLPYIEGTESQGLQYTDDDGNIVKVELVANPLPEWNVTGFRDPFVWKSDDGVGNMLIAGGFKGYDEEADETTYLGGAIFYYHTVGTDLLQWEAQAKPFFEPRTTPDVNGFGDAIFGGNIEVANYFTLEDERTGSVAEFLTISVEFPAETRTRAVKWVKGTIEEDEEGNTVFEWTRWGYLDQGMMYAPTTMIKKGERTLFGWLHEQSDPPLALGGMSGVIGIPRIISLQTRSIYSIFPEEESDIWELSWTRRGVQYVTFGQKPTQEIEELRGDRLFSIEAQGANSAVAVQSEPLANTQRFQIDVTARFAAGETVAFNVLSDDDQFTTVSYDFDTQLLTIDYSQSSATPENIPDGDGAYNAQCGLVSNWNFRDQGFVTEDLFMQIFVDGSTVEVFVNERCVTSARAFPDTTDADAITYTGTAPVSSLNIWEVTDSIFQ